MFNVNHNKLQDTHLFVPDIVGKERKKMQETSIWSDTIGWQTVDKKLNSQTAMMNESLARGSRKGGKKIKRRTKLLNRELKKFAVLRTYSQYVRVKTAILRNISDNEDTEDEQSPMSPSSLISLYNSDDESRFHDLSQPPHLLTDDPTNLPSHKKPKAAQDQRNNDNSTTKSYLSRIQLSKNKIFSKGETSLDNKEDDTHSREQAVKDERVVGKLKGRSSARRNLTSLLESFDNATPLPLIEEPQTVQTAASVKRDDDDANNNDNNDIDRVNGNNNSNNNTESQSNGKSGEIVEMRNVQPGDSGIDDDSQDNLPVNDRANDIIIIPNDEQNKDSHQDYFQGITEISCSRVDDRNNDVRAEGEVDADLDLDEDQVSETKPEMEQQQQQSIVMDEMLRKKCQPTITCTELVKSKYMIIRDDDNEREKEGDGDEFTRQGSSGREDEIVHEKEITEMEIMSPETRRLSQMKRINLICSGETDSDSSQDEIILKRAYSQGKMDFLASHGISDPSDSDESVESIDISEYVDNGLSVSSSLLSSGTAFPISDNGNIVHRQQDNITPIIRYEKKSIKSQIEEQDTDDDNSPVIDRRSVIQSSRRCSFGETIDEQVGARRKNPSDNIMTRTKERSIVSSTIRPTSTDAESLQYVLNNLSTRSSFDAHHLLYANVVDNSNNVYDNTQEQNGSERNQYPDETSSRRPIELHDFIARQELVPTSELPTITIDDVINCTEHDGDDEIWLIEIPKMIAHDQQLCGKNISLEKTSMRIGETRYNITRRNEKSVSCILRTGSKKKARYKTVNVRAIGSIVVRHESTGINGGTSGTCDDMTVMADAACKIVPFPKNLKSRNPLMAPQETDPDDDEKIVLASDKTKRKNKTRRGRLWDIDNFILKSKRT